MVKPNYSKKQPITTKIHPEFTDALLTNYGGGDPVCGFFIYEARLRACPDGGAGFGDGVQLHLRR